MSTATTVNLQTLGVGAGIDSAGIQASLVAVAKLPLTALQTMQASIQSASQTISTFSSQLSTLQAAARAMSDPVQYSSYTASSSDASVVASTSGSPLPGSHTVQVTALAQAQRTNSITESSNTAALGLSGTLGITIGGTLVNVPIAAGDSLATIATNISSSGARVGASVMFDGTNYRLQVQSLDTGAANAVTFGETGFALGLSDPTNTKQIAQDASAKVDLLTVTSPTNQLINAIPGVKLALTAVSSTAATVIVGADPNALTQKVTAFITAYNTVVATGHTSAGYGSVVATNPLLSADRGIETSLSRLSSLMVTTVPGTTGAYQSLSSVGIHVNADGTLTLNSATLAAAVQADPVRVERLFVTDPTNGSTGIMSTFSTTIDGLATNSGAPLQAELAMFTARTKAIVLREADLQRRLDAYTAHLKVQFAAMDQEVTKQRALFSQVGGTGTFV